MPPPQHLLSIPPPAHVADFPAGNRSRSRDEEQPVEAPRPRLRDLPTADRGPPRLPRLRRGSPSRAVPMSRSVEGPAPRNGRCAGRLPGSVACRRRSLRRRTLQTPRRVGWAPSGAEGDDGGARRRPWRGTALLPPRTRADALKTRRRRRGGVQGRRAAASGASVPDRKCRWSSARPRVGDGSRRFRRSDRPDSTLSRRVCRRVHA